LLFFQCGLPRQSQSWTYPSVAAEVLFCAGVLTGWIGSRDEIKEADEAARDLLTESMRLYEALGDPRKVAEVKSELRLCYWRAGELDEARVMVTQALQKLTAPGNTRANALINLSVIEWSASRYNRTLKILTDNAPLFEKIASNTTKGTYHNQRAMILRKLVTPRKQNRTKFCEGRTPMFLDRCTNHSRIALARLNQTERAQFTFQKAIEVAHQAGALNRAGLAALTMIEEIDRLPPETLFAAYEQAGEWLSDSQRCIIG
jgi:tetratricopeptide (TPR) repeat protein